VQLGPLVACAGFHPPAVLAKMAATVDEISGGRLVLGLGSGWNEAEFRAFGIPFDHRVSRFEEAFAIIRGLLDGERVTLEGRFWQGRGRRPLPAPRRRPPLMIGSNGPPYARHHAAARRCLEHLVRRLRQHRVRVRGAERHDHHGRPGGRPAAEAIDRSACVFIVLDRQSPERPIVADAPPLEGGADRIAAALHDLAAAGADEAILVVSPITAASIGRLAEVLSVLDR
jgi:alkanesulfonate monooxygenase SsuD/methylene tetrahydromethanopterin reductase-like flavin-dependent oxidoreductase (luciferase family)